MNSAECLLRLVLALLPSLERTDSWSTDTWRMFWSSWLECLLACDAVFLLRGIPANGLRQAMACYWFSQDSLQLRAQHNDRERQRLNQPNLSIFSKILAARNTLPHTRSSHYLQTIIKFFFLLHMAIPGHLLYLDPKNLCSSEVWCVGEEILITSAFQKTPGNLSTRGHDSKSI